MTDDDLKPSLSKAEQKFSAELRRRRESSGLLQRELAKHAGFPRPYISRAEKPGGLVSPRVVKAVDDALDADGVLIELHARAVKERKERLQRKRSNNSLVETPKSYSDYVDHFTIVLSPATPSGTEHSGISLNGHIHELARIQRVDQQIGPGRALHLLTHLLRTVNGDLTVSHGVDRIGLLRIASQAAEFAGFLYRDLNSEGQCLYWHDRAIEYAQQADDQPMQAYVLLRKAQAAYDRRDARRMLDLTLAAQRISTVLQPSLRAEILQQRARGEAMLGASMTEVQRRLAEASTTLDTAEKTAREQDSCTRYNQQLLGFQSAICISETGHPGDAVRIYREMISPNLPPRDHAYYSILMAASLALSGEPDEAARVACTALGTAGEMGSRRSIREVRKLSTVLEPWRGRHQVQALDYALRRAEKKSAG